MMAELPILPLKTDALLADTTHMSAEEFGAYCRILFVMWRQGARLPDQDAELALIAGVTLRRWRKIAGKVRRPLTSAGGVLSQKRLTGTFLEVQAVRKKRAKNAESRWKNNIMPMQMDMQNACKTHANQIRKNITSSEYAAARESRDDISKKKLVNEEKNKSCRKQITPAELAVIHGRVP